MGTAKALLPLNGTPLALHHLERFRSVGLEDVRIVVGSDAANIRAQLDSSGLVWVLNPTPELGQFSSLKAGLESWNGAQTLPALLVLTPVDCPPVAPWILRRLLESFPDTGTALARIPTCRGQRGHPIVLNRSLLQGLLHAHATSSLRTELETLCPSIAEIEVGAPEILWNINTPDDLRVYQASPESART